MTTLRSLIKDSKGKFFSITFIKKDGTSRTINGKNRYNRLLSTSNHPSAGKNTVRAAGYESFVNRNGEYWAAAKDENLVRFSCGHIQETFKV